jgi:hypothetical protein
MRGPDGVLPKSSEDLPAGARVEQSATGTSVAGPGFHVWDADHDTAVGWARQLARALPRRSVRGSPPCDGPVARSEAQGILPRDGDSPRPQRTDGDD